VTSRLRLEEVDHVFEHATDVLGFEIELEPASEADEVVEDRLGTLDLALESLEALQHPALARREGLGQVFPHHLQVDGERGKRILDLVGQASGQTAQEAHAVAAT
jgi:hypothetical protein